MKFVTRPVFYIAAMLMLAPGALAADRDDLAEVVEAAVSPLLVTHDVPGIAVAVLADGERHFFNFGQSARDGGMPVSEETLFEIGSVSKTFTATLGAYAAEQGFLSLDDHPGRYMAELADTPIDAATLLHLATYTAGGLPLQFPGGVTSDDAAPAYFARFAPETAPGAFRVYSNPSIGLFGHLAARAMGDDFTTLMENEILAGLGLDHTYIDVPETAMADYAWGHDSAGRQRRASPGTFDAEAYGIKSSSADMIDFAATNIDPAGLDPDLRGAVEATHLGHFTVGPMVQGLGWEHYPWPVPLERLLAGNARDMAMAPNAATALVPPQAPDGPTLFNKTGSTAGFGAYVAFVPAEGIGIVLLANRNFPIPDRIKAAHAILGALSAP